ncbi:hypothetical protein LTR56_010781 [Elasticomyces elasticus]|nr:hypothetical protein LTR56_010781 [Elasticomyces elasticus]KAK3667806.1 hypothetical protein LTR22_001251 [Elasticomyces elasticus]KAK4932201.1 hypothetical protein LTR49_001498 [Elasticomyces elasticus]KAK5763419.1 hypothetical protein LTS12_006390 [Elasticomyces elasticus]
MVVATTGRTGLVIVTTPETGRSLVIVTTATDVSTGVRTDVGLRFINTTSISAYHSQRASLHAPLSATRQEDQQTKHDVVEMADQLPNLPLRPSTVVRDPSEILTDQDRILFLIQELARRDKVIADLYVTTDAFGKVMLTSTEALVNSKAEVDRMSAQLANHHNGTNTTPPTSITRDHDALIQELTRKDEIIEDLKATKRAFGKMTAESVEECAQAKEAVDRMTGHAGVRDNLIEMLKERIEDEEGTVEILKGNMQLQSEIIEAHERKIAKDDKWITKAGGIMKSQREKIATLEERDQVLKRIETVFGEMGFRV